jgi:hypothetical protein
MQEESDMPTAPGETASEFGCPETLAADPTGSPAIAAGDLAATAGPGTAGAETADQARAEAMEMQACDPNMAQ